MMRNIELGDDMEVTTATTVEVGAVIHVRFEGKSEDILLGDLNVALDTPDNLVKTAVANWIDVEEGAFDKFVVERNDNGDMTIRPEAVFGSCID